MKYLFIVFGFFVLILFLVVIALPKNTSTTNSATEMNSVTINSATFTVKLAITPEEQRKGLSGVSSLADDEGMLFVYETPTYSSFWMRGMKIPLDIIFILDDKVVGVFENLRPAAAEDANPPTWGGELLSNRVLEINAGLVKKYDIKVGDKVVYKGI